MDLASLSAATGRNSGLESNNSAFREADFLAIMLAEITNQDPFEPTETSKIVENTQKLQELANTQYGKFRDDVRWAQDLLGEEVSVQQMIMTEAQYTEHIDRGLRPNRGYAQSSGQVDNFRILGESVWLTVDGFDYPIDNVKSIIPKAPGSEPGVGGNGGTNLASLADSLLGRVVKAGTDAGQVQEVRRKQDNTYEVIIAGGKSVNFTDITSIGL